MNRRIKRVLMAEASKIGGEMARTCVDYLPSGAAVRVQDHRAVTALERAFAAMLRGGCTPLVMQITPDVARAFPRASVAPASATPWLAVGIDGQGLGTYALRWLSLAAKDGANHRALAELAMLAELSCETARQGFPMGQAMGRA